MNPRNREIRAVSVASAVGVRLNRASLLHPLVTLRHCVIGPGMRLLSATNCLYKQTFRCGSRSFSSLHIYNTNPQAKPSQKTSNNLPKWRPSSTFEFPLPPRLPHKQTANPLFQERRKLRCRDRPGHWRPGFQGGQQAYVFHPALNMTYVPHSNYI